MSMQKPTNLLVIVLHHANWKLGYMSCIMHVIKEENKPAVPVSQSEACEPCVKTNDYLLVIVLKEQKSHVKASN